MALSSISSVGCASIVLARRQLGSDVGEYFSSLLGDKQPMHLQKVFANSMFKCFVYEGSKLVAAGRALADGADCSYICDIAALPSHQGTGLGKQVVAHLVEVSRGHKKIILYAVPGKEPFYRKFGFMRKKPNFR